MQKKLFYKLMLVTNRQQTPMDDYLQFIKICAHAGITSVQLREKNQAPGVLYEFGVKLKHILDPLQIPLIVNDDIELALKLNASGVHLGQTDGNPEQARALLGPDKIIGVSIDTEENLIIANQLRIDYVGIGAIFPTSNKNNVATIWGVDGLRQLAPHSKHPIIGIGGINESNAPEVLASGASGIAVIGALHESENPTLTTHNLRHTLDNRGK